MMLAAGSSLGWVGVALLHDAIMEQMMLTVLTVEAIGWATAAGLIEAL